MLSDDAEVCGLRLLRFRQQHGPAGGRIGHDAEKLRAFLAGVGVEVVALGDGLGIAGLERGVTDAAVQGDVAENEAVARLVVGESEMLARLLVERLEIRGDQVAGAGFQPCGEIVGADVPLLPL